ncbi:uncharacterized protein EI90DRAFT_3197220 [Cantharellus anzutake]|uniref:uncharacterized protein n=1 Tax=Cantharellus anzutake TaxID=1750568 RepID=UPI0019054043|nr:uncharacterized protein EI90DRAFT_3197220 [Cantharellus anzutake]KAF8311327.1 hypothetical protein EI90DRAFT_3197220 [Cantharellus anzutake]
MNTPNSTSTTSTSPEGNDLNAPSTSPSPMSRTNSAPQLDLYGHATSTGTSGTYAPLGPHAAFSPSPSSIPWSGSSHYGLNMSIPSAAPTLANYHQNSRGPPYSQNPPGMPTPAIMQQYSMSQSFASPGTHFQDASPVNNLAPYGPPPTQEACEKLINDFVQKQVDEKMITMAQQLEQLSQQVNENTTSATTNSHTEPSSRRGQAKDKWPANGRPGIEPRTSSVHPYTTRPQFGVLASKLMYRGLSTMKKFNTASAIDLCHEFN